MIRLGSRVKDSITGFTGIAIGRTDWLYGCSRICVEPEKLQKDGKAFESLWFDEQRIIVIKEMGPKVSKSSSATTGGPHNDNSSQRSDPRR